MFLVQFLLSRPTVSRTSVSEISLFLSWPLKTFSCPYVVMHAEFKCLWNLENSDWVCSFQFVFYQVPRTNSKSLAHHAAIQTLCISKNSYHKKNKYRYLVRTGILPSSVKPLCPSPYSLGKPDFYAVPKAWSKSPKWFTFKYKSYINNQSNSQILFKQVRKLPIQVNMMGKCSKKRKIIPAMFS